MDERIITPYCFLVQQIEGAVEEYLQVLDFLESSLHELAEERGEKLLATEFQLSVAKGIKNHDIGRRVMFDILVYIGVNGMNVKAESVLAALRAVVTSPPVEGVGEHTGAIGEIPQAGGKELTQLRQTEKTVFPTSKMFWHQREIAQYGGNTVSVDVGGGATITASISGADGKEINITPTQVHIQAVVGQLISENGSPITVTPAQLYRAFAGLPSDACVTEEQEASMEAAMDSLLFTEATLNIEKQLEKHTRLEKNPNVDYGEFINRRANLIVGVKDTDSTVTYNGRSVRVSYTIYQAPLLYQYSYAINQLATVSRELLQGGTAAALLPKGHPDRKTPKRKERTVLLRRYLMAQVERIKADKKKKKPKGHYSEHLTFETIASECDVQLSPKLMRTLRDDVGGILADFAAAGYIVSAEEYKAGRAAKGVRITL